MAVFSMVSSTTTLLLSKRPSLTHFNKGNNVFVRNVGLGVPSLRRGSHIIKSSYDNSVSVTTLPSELKPVTEEDIDPVKRSDFPTDFLFGAGTSALQTEGTKDRGSCTWDYMLGNRPQAVDSYHKYMEDIQMLKQMGGNVYRFSIAWTRIFPTGKPPQNDDEKAMMKEGIKFYNDLIDELIANGIEPFVTLYHYDMPTQLQNLYGGWEGDQIVRDFVEYADVCFSNFGDRVKKWTTINEPHIVSAYTLMKDGPVRKRILADLTGEKPYIQARNILLAHAHAYKLYKDKYKKTQGGEVGICMLALWYLPYSEQSIDDKRATIRAWDFSTGWYLEPLLRGDYPFIMKAIVKERLKAFTEEEVQILKGSFDFISLNYYTGKFSKSLPFNENETPDYDKDRFVTLSDKDANGNDFGTMPGNVFPRGLKQILIYLKENYNNPVIYISENGYADVQDPSGPREIEDKNRLDYIKNHLIAARDAIRWGAKVNGYIGWSLIDCMEVGSFDPVHPDSAYQVRMGLNYVDYREGANLQRGPRKSAEWFHDFMNGVLEN